MKKILERFEGLEVHHKILTFIFVICATIIITRLGVLVYDPNPVVFGFELHHFDYGFLLLVICLLALLFREEGRHSPVLLFLSAIALGLIMDTFWIIRNGLLDVGLNETLIYNQSLPSAVVLSIWVFLTSATIRHFAKKNRK